MKAEAGLTEYLRDLRLTEADLQGNRVLDLGAGSRLFAYDCLEKGLCHVTSIDIETSWWTKGLKGNVGWESVIQRSVKGNASRLPFADGAFDVVLSRGGVPQMLAGYGEKQRAYLEMVRVMAVGGWGVLFPAWMEHWEEDEQWTVKLLASELDGVCGVTALWGELQTVVETGRRGQALTIRKA